RKRDNSGHRTRKLFSSTRTKNSFDAFSFCRRTRRNRRFPIQSRCLELLEQWRRAMLQPVPKGRGIERDFFEEMEQAPPTARGNPAVRKFHAWFRSYMGF